MTNKYPASTPNCVLDVLENITAPTAYWLLSLMDCSNEEVYTESFVLGDYNPQKHVYYDPGSSISVKELVKQDSVSWLLANNVKITFWGGPPTQLAWYHGTLQDLIVDRILDYYTKNSLEALMEKLCLNVH